MKKTPLTEDRLIPRLTRGWGKAASVLVGVGDDCAVVRRPGKALLFKTDAVVEGVHFLPETPGALVGRKALARAVSDAAAMGGTPTHALVTLGLPPGTPLRRVEAVYRGLSALARKCGVALVGGETTRAPALFLSIALLGEAPPRPVLRSGGRPGDDLWVTGTLGANATRTGKERHLRFEPRLAEGRWLAEKKIARAMMDLSDGLAADLPRLATASRCGFVVDRAALPLAPGASPAAALAAGEDYELLFAAPRRFRARLASSSKAFWPLKTRLTRIGSLVPKGRGESQSSLGHGFDHFQKP